MQPVHAPEAVELHFRRSALLADRIANRIRTIEPAPKFGLDIGAQDGYVTELVTERTGVRFVAADPFPEVKPGIAVGIPRVRCAAERLPFRPEKFDLVMMNSVFEHIAPGHLESAAGEIHRVLRPGGHLVGQMPNMHYPVESHSWLPFQQFLPAAAGRWYYEHFSPHRALNPEGITWYRNSGPRVDLALRASGFAEGRMYPANYPREVYPPAARRFYRLLSLVPVNFDYLYRRTG